MSSPRPFLTARWSNLCIISYTVTRSVLESHLPPGLELDERDGTCFASLVAFDFLDTRIRGLRIPGHTNFPEVNLRFYVREGRNRGVVFIREFVPRRWIAGIARAAYNEPYVTARMTSRVEEASDRITVQHQFSRGPAVGGLALTGIGPPAIPLHDSLEHFFKEHTWGFGTSRGGQLLRYRVQHPVWATYRVESHSLHIDWPALYGPKWHILREQKPVSVVLAAGSPVTVYPKGVQLPDDLTPSAPHTPSDARSPATSPPPNPR